MGNAGARVESRVRYLFFCALIGCSSATVEPAGDAGAPSPDGGASSADGGTPSTPGTDASKDDSTAPAEARLYPLEVGHKWTYDVAAVGGGAVCTPGTRSSEVKAKRTVSGREAFEVSSFCAAAGTSTLAVDGDKVQVLYNGTWLTVTDPRLEDGHQWTFYNTSYTWRRETSVTVPAGTFDDCWTAVQNVSYSAFTTYCRGVGPVRSYSRDLNGAGWDAKLSAKSF
jgi:hypothetical protein